MKFPYLKFPASDAADFFGKESLRPIIPVGFKANNLFIRYQALIDSGADICLFHAGVAEVLDIDIASGYRFVFQGAQQGKVSTGYFHPITLVLGGRDYSTVVAFTDDLSQDGYGLLGQKGFLICFVLPLILKKKRSN